MSQETKPRPRTPVRLGSAAGRLVAMPVLAAWMVASAAATGLGSAFPFNPNVAAPFFTPPDTGGGKTRAPFLAPKIDAPHPFVPPIGRNPARICDALDDAGFANLGWKASALGASGECLATTPQSDAAEEANSLFYMLRGPGRIDQARLKINLPDPANAGETLDRAVALLKAFSTTIRLDIPDQVVSAVGKGEPLEFATERVVYAMKREYGDVTRYNFSIEFRPNPQRLYWVPDLGVIVPVPASPAPLAAEVATTAKTARLKPETPAPGATSGNVD